MKTISLQIEDNLYTALVALIQQLPADKVQIVNDSQPLADKVTLCDTIQFRDTLQATEYLTSSAANAQDLLDAVKEIKERRNFTKHNLIEA